MEQLSLNLSDTSEGQRTKQQEAADKAPIKRRRGRPPSNRPKTEQEIKNIVELLDLSFEIDEKPAKENNQLGMIASSMIYASFPHRAVKGAVFKRRNGDISCTILNDPDIGLPYGKLPRIITVFLCTEAKRTKEPVIHLGRSFNDFAKKLGLSTGGGKRGDLTRLNDQAKRTFTSRITLVGTPDSKFGWRDVSLTEEGMLLWDPHNPKERAPWESKLTLSNKFFIDCINHSVPIDLRVLHKLRSTLAIDIYIWMSYRYNSLSKSTPISWRQLKSQFGADYAENDQGLRSFIYNFKAQLRKVTSVYRTAKFSVDQHTLTLHPSSPHILPRLPKL